MVHLLVSHELTLQPSYLLIQLQVSEVFTDVEHGVDQSLSRPAPGLDSKVLALMILQLYALNLLLLTHKLQLFDIPVIHA